MQEGLLFKQIYSYLSERAYINVIGKDGKVIQEGLVMNTDFNAFMERSVKNIDPDLQKIDKMLTVGVMNIVIY